MIVSQDDLQGFELFYTIYNVNYAKWELKKQTFL